MHEDQNSIDFQTTRWSVVIAAGKNPSAGSNAAMAELCERYWYPLYAFARRKTRDHHQAQDLLQAFFAKLLENNYVADADPSRGTFRTFLITALTRFMNNQWKMAKALKRGGGFNRLSIDYEVAERRFRNSLAQNETPELLFQRQWALELLDQTVTRLRKEFVGNGKEQQFEHLKSAIVFDESKLPYSEIAQRLNNSEACVKVQIHRLRQRFRQILREIIGETVRDETEIESEISQLFRAFSATA